MRLSLTVPHCVIKSDLPMSAAKDLLTKLNRSKACAYLDFYIIYSGKTDLYTVKSVQKAYISAPEFFYFDE